MRKEIIAPFNSYCKKCLLEISVGDKIIYDVETKDAFHICCPEDPNSIIITLRGDPLPSGRVIERDGYYYTIKQSGPAFFVNEENVNNICHGGKKGYFYCARVRLATDEESCELISKKEEQQLKDIASQILGDIAKMIRQSGHKPNGDFILSKEYDIGTFSVPEYFFITEEWIWFVVQNPSDEWTQKNVRGGGEGYRVSYTRELADMIIDNFTLLKD